jgi:catechol 2,3-dioxygenase-like lactoylglutathione lyase family enzyme
MDVPPLAGVHHLKLPVRDLVRSRHWYESRLGYQVQMEFVEEGVLRSLALQHPAGGPQLALRLDPQRTEAAAGFDYFAIGVTDEAWPVRTCPPSCAPVSRDGRMCRTGTIFCCASERRCACSAGRRRPARFWVARDAPDSLDKRLTAFDDSIHDR